MNEQTETKPVETKPAEKPHTIRDDWKIAMTDWSTNSDGSWQDSVSIWIPVAMFLVIIFLCAVGS